MTENVEFPGYISRPEEQQIQVQAALVGEDGQSRVVLLYGEGGAGKTTLVRELARERPGIGRTVWLAPIDVDDSEYWLLSNLEQQVIREIDPQARYFGKYLEYVSRLPMYTHRRVDHDTVASHLGRIKQVFKECFASFITATGSTVVITFDTVEAIRGMYLLLTLTQWMKALPATLFILSGRPPSQLSAGQDPIRQELEDPYQGLPVTAVTLGDFAQDDARAYLDSSGVASGLSAEEKENLVLLSRGHPLWLAFTISYLASKGIPEEAEETAHAAIRQDVTYQGEMNEAGRQRHEAFKRRLVTPYRDTDFWHEAVKRLAVVRHSINRTMWQQLMSDRPLPDDVTSPEQAWEELLKIPWIRPRANGRFVTLHDAVAEELAQRIIPVHDLNKQWRLELWRRSADIYHERVAARHAELDAMLPALDRRLESLDERRQADEAAEGMPAGAMSASIGEVSRADVLKGRLDQLKAAGLYYQLLSDGQAGCHQFLELFEQAKADRDVIFQDLLAFEMQRFLPGEGNPYAPGDVIGDAIEDFRRWLAVDGSDLHLSIGLSISDYLIKNEQPETAVKLLDNLPATEDDHRRQYRKAILRGNAYMRIPRHVRESVEHFERALSEAAALPAPDRDSLMAKAQKELGFFYRNEGEWRKADGAYRKARDIISAAMSADSSPEDREEMASIQTNWAYVKGLTGNYREGQNLVESAITVRRNLGQRQAEGNSWSVSGEVYRYERRFQKAWEAYAEAERIFTEQRTWPWLGLVYQEQAICLFQAQQDGIRLISGEPGQEAKRLITLALDICRDQAILSYPSALNRAGRIFGQEDFEAGFDYLADGIEWARRLSDGWFLFANLLEYVELSYRAWVETGQQQQEFLDRISSRTGQIDAAMSEYEFPDLRGRWRLLHGHLGIRRWQQTGDQSHLQGALEDYAEGFVMVAQEYVGSSGASAIPAEFRRFKDLFVQLDPEVRRHWHAELRRSWSGAESGSTLLLARLEELY